MLWQSRRWCYRSTPTKVSARTDLPLQGFHFVGSFFWFLGFGLSVYGCFPLHCLCVFLCFQHTSTSESTNVILLQYGQAIKQAKSQTVFNSVRESLPCSYSDEELDEWWKSKSLAKQVTHNLVVLINVHTTNWDIWQARYKHPLPHRGARVAGRPGTGRTCRFVSK